MKFSLASLRNNKAPPKGVQPGVDSGGAHEQRSVEDQSHSAAQRKASQILAITLSLAAALSSIAWAIAAYLIEREKQRAKVELARLEVEAKKE